MSNDSNLDSHIANDSHSDINFLRKLLPEAQLYSYQILVKRFMDLLISDINQSVNNHIGRKDIRIGCYGPYTKEELPFILELMKNISGRGFSSITGSSFLLPSSIDFQPMESIYSPIAQREIAQVDKIEFYRNFVRLTEKALINLNDIRTQFPEAEGCDIYAIPSLGFIIHEKISDENNCIYLQQSDTYSECYAPNKTLCEAQFDKESFCPFHESVNVPAALRDIFIREGNRLIAVMQLEDLFPILDEFLAY